MSGWDRLDDARDILNIRTYAMLRAQKAFRMYPSAENWITQESAQLAYQQAWIEHEDLAIKKDNCE
jgi:hypothetical protein